MEPVLFAGLVFLGVLLVAGSMLMGQELDPVQARLAQIAVRARTLEELELQRPLSERTLRPIINSISRLIGRFYPKNTVNSVEIKLKRAGMENTSTEFFLGVKGFAAVVGAIAASSILNLMTADLTYTVAGLFGGLIVGFIAPDLYLSSKAGSRAGGILNQLPHPLHPLPIPGRAGPALPAAPPPGRRPRGAPKAPPPRQRPRNRTGAPTPPPRGAPADSFFSRAFGLIPRARLPEGEGLLITKTSSITMWLMRFSIDAVFLDKGGRVVRVAEHLPLWRLATAAKGARDVLELPAGTAARTATQAGDELVFEPSS